jgi:hypothetical protein
MNPKILVKGCNRFLKEINFIVFVSALPKHSVSLKWLQFLFNESMKYLSWQLKQEGNVFGVLDKDVNGLIDWYSTDQVHPLKPLPKPIKDAFWGCYKALFDAAGLSFNYHEQLQQFYNEGEIPEPNIHAVEFPKPSDPLQYIAAKERKAKAWLDKPVFSIPTYTPELTRLDKKVKAFCEKILEVYQKGNLSQLEFDKKSLSFQEKNAEAIEDLESEDREAFPEFVSSFAAILGLSQHVF